jgi:hypothetical protein
MGGSYCVTQVVNSFHYTIIRHESVFIEADKDTPMWHENQ